MKSLTQSIKDALLAGFFLAACAVSASSVNVIDSVVHSNMLTVSKPGLEQVLARESLFATQEQKDIYRDYGVIATNNPYHIPRELRFDRTYLVEIIPDEDLPYKLGLLKEELGDYTQDLIRFSGLKYIFIGNEYLRVDYTELIMNLLGVNHTPVLNSINKLEGFIEVKTNYCRLSFMPFLTPARVIYLTSPKDFHHELFHLLRGNLSCKLSLKKWPDVNITSDMKDLPVHGRDISSPLLQHGFLNGYGYGSYIKGNEEEDQADFYSLIASSAFDSNIMSVTGKPSKQEAIKYLEDSNPIIREKVEWMNEFLKQVSYLALSKNTLH